MDITRNRGTPGRAPPHITAYSLQKMDTFHILHATGARRGASLGVHEHHDALFLQLRNRMCVLFTVKNGYHTQQGHAEARASAYYRIFTSKNGYIPHHQSFTRNRGTLVRAPRRP
jgi:hypothetical protein